MATFGDDFVFGDPGLNVWDDSMSEEQKQQTLEIFKDDIQDLDTVKRAMGNIYSYNLFFHEICHFYQTKGLPLLFSESGAAYYETEVATKKTGAGFTSEEYEAGAVFYKSLVEKYGDDVHKFFFGSISSDNTMPNYNPKAREILSEWTPEVQQRLFPNTKIVTS